MNNAGRMSDFIEKAEGLLANMESKYQRDLITQEKHEALLTLYGEQSKMDREIVNDSIHLTERRWSSMRLFITSIVGFVLIAGLSGGVAINNRPTKDYVDENYPTTEELFRGFAGMTDGLYEDLEEYGVMTEEEA
ncbi:MAG: hypothetical protein KAQ85_04665, partial [Thermodesulfovibrionia bacterium]|nr:hypothetical protein [Thermodesulfovibrionia bacterium]